MCWQKRQIKREIETLKKVEEMQHEAMEANRELLSVASRRRAVSGIDDRQRLALLERERQARLRNNAATSALLYAAASPPQMGIPASPMYLGSPGLGLAASPRVRAVSATHHGLPSMASPADLLASERLSAASAPGGSPRIRTVSTGLSPAALERMRLEERERALTERENALQHERENRLRAKKSALELADHERHLRKRERDFHQRSMLNAKDSMLNREEAILHEREREMRLEDDIERRLRNFNVHVSAMCCHPV